MMETSIIIPTKCIGRHINRCLDSICKKTDLVKTEIILVDDNSNKTEIQTIANSYKIKVISLLNNEIFSFSKAVNMGVKEATGEKIIILNDDVIVTDNWINKFDKILKEGYSLAAPLRLHGTFGIAQWINPAEYNNLIIPLRFSTQTIDKAIKIIEEYNQNLCEGLIFSCNTFVPFYCVMTTKNIWKEVNGLNESFIKGFYEDNLFCDTLLAKNKKIGIALDCAIFHFGSATFLEFQTEEELEALNQQNYIIYSNKKEKIKKEKNLSIKDFIQKEITAKFPNENLSGFVDCGNSILISFKSGKKITLQKP